MTLPNALGFILCGTLAIGCGDSNTGGTGGTGGGQSVNNCPDVCSVITSCTGQSTESCMEQCEGDLMQATEFSAACRAAVNDLTACVGGLSCEQLDAWFEEVPADSYPCIAEEIAVEEC